MSATGQGSISGDLSGRVAVVSGAGRGIGRAEALAMAAEGASLVVNDLGCTPNGVGTAHGPADEVVREIKAAGGQAVANYDSVATPEGAQRIIKTALDSFGRIDILVNNAGLVLPRHIIDMSIEDFDSVMKVNLYGTFYCIKFACEAMRQQHYGRIINTSSEAGLGKVRRTAYSAAKEGIVGLTRSVARDMGPLGVTCNAVRPRASTRMINEPDAVRMRKDLKDSGALDDLAGLESCMPEHVASLVTYLASGHSANINGQVFMVGGNAIKMYAEPVSPAKFLYARGAGWSYRELIDVMPETLAKEVVNPAPANRDQK